jgi:plastocyanin
MRTPLIALASLIALACSSDSTGNSQPPASDVTIVSGAATKGASAFDPNPFTISLAGNATVKWGNADGTTHTVTADGGAFSSGNIGAGGTFSHTFTATGSYPYHCTIHAGMVGTIVVNP